MITLYLVQGSPEWHTHRATHFNASDAPAMLGMSPYKTRTELLHELHTGLSPEVNDATQRLFDAGHAAEAAARPVAEREIGEELYPIVGSEGKLSASFDGLTMDGTIAWEHKLLNIALLESLDNGIIPDSYHPQLEQQLMVSGAEKVLFMATSPCGTAMECVWYTSNPELRSRILQGWAQFAIDLAAYVPVEPVAKPVGRSPETLPALHIEVTGMVTASNLAEYKAHALAVFGSINRELVTDQDFASAESTVKWCGEIEARLAAAKQHALSQTESIDALFRTIDDISAEARATRLELDKLVKVRKDSIRTEIVSDGRNALADHMDALGARIGRHLMPSVAVDFASAIKGKRTLDSMRDAVATELARAKIEANAVADRITLNLRTINAHTDHAFLFTDVAQLVLKAPDDLDAVVQNRINAHQAKEAARIEAERARIASEERAKAEATERSRADAEIAAATAQARTEENKQAAADTEAKHASDEAIEKAQAEHMSEEQTLTLATAPPCHQTVVPNRTPVLSEKADADRSAAAYINQIEAEHPTAIAPVAPQTAARYVSHIPLSAPTLRLGQICERLGFTLTADFLKSLGFEHAATDKAAKLYHENDFHRICLVLVRHIQKAAQVVEA